MRKTIIFLIFFSAYLVASDNMAIKVFQGYCWGCHHQTAQAFGPSFRSIANKRTKGEIIAQIRDPKDTYKMLGYKINSMPAFNDLNNTQLNAIVTYILSFKDKK